MTRACTAVRRAADGRSDDEGDDEDAEAEGPAEEETGVPEESPTYDYVEVRRVAWAGDCARR